MTGHPEVSSGCRGNFRIADNLEVNPKGGVDSTPSANLIGNSGVAPKPVAACQLGSSMITDIIVHQDNDLSESSPFAELNEWFALLSTVEESFTCPTSRLHVHVIRSLSISELAICPRSHVPHYR